MKRRPRPDSRVADLLASLPPEARARLRESPQPGWISPMLATLTYRRFSDPNWLFELKFDGERCLAFRNGSSVRLFSRNQKLLNNTYPEIAEAIGLRTTARVAQQFATGHHHDRQVGYGYVEPAEQRLRLGLAFEVEPFRRQS